MYLKVLSSGCPGKSKPTFYMFVLREAVKLLVEKVGGSSNEDLTAR